jgi:hypothetical protein
MSSWKDAASVVTAAVAVIALIAGYVKFVLQRAILPCVEFDVNFSALRSGAERHQCEIVLTVKNVGPGSGYVANVQGRVRYAEAGESDVARDAVEPAFPHSLQPSSKPEAAAARGVDSAAGTELPEESPLILKGSGFLFQPALKPAFIQPGVTQVYRKPIALPGKADLVHVWAAFHYTIQAGPLTRFFARIFVSHAKAQRQLDYTVRRTFTITAAD